MSKCKTKCPKNTKKSYHIYLIYRFIIHGTLKKNIGKWGHTCFMGVGEKDSSKCVKEKLFLLKKSYLAISRRSLLSDPDVYSHREKCTFIP